MSAEELDRIYNKIAAVYNVPEDKKFNENDDLDTKRAKLRDIRDFTIAMADVKTVEQYNADKGTTDTNKPDSLLKDTYNKIEKDEQAAANAASANKPTTTATSELVNKALDTKDEQERRQLIEQMSFQELEEYYKLLKEKYPNAEIPEEIEADFANQDIDSVRVKLLSVKLGKEAKSNKPNAATSLNADTKQIEQTIKSQENKNTKLEEETKKKIEISSSAAESDTKASKTTADISTAATTSTTTPSDQIGREILAAQNKTNDLLSQILAAILNKAEEITTPETETSAGAKGAAPGSRPNPTNSKAHEMASNIIAGMKGVLKLFNGTKLAGA